MRCGKWGIRGREVGIEGAGSGDREPLSTLAIVTVNFRKRLHKVLHLATTYRNDSKLPQNQSKRSPAEIIIRLTHI